MKREQEAILDKKDALISEMKKRIEDVQFALQELSLRSIEMIERTPIRHIINEMNLIMYFIKFANLASF
jgi:hypothetical protein